MKKEISEKAFNKEILAQTGLTIVLFKSDWNGACQISSMIYEELARSYSGILHFFSIDIEEESSLRAHYGIIEIPAILFFRNGNLVDHVIGLVPKNVLITKIENVLAEANASH